MLNVHRYGPLAGSFGPHPLLLLLLLWWEGQISAGVISQITYL